MLGTFSGGGLGFGVAFSLYDDFTNTASRIESSLKSLGIAGQATMDKMNQAQNQMAVGAGMMAVGLATLVPVGMGVKIAGEFEQARLGLQTLLGSKEAAEEMFKGIKEDAATSSFDVESMLKVNRALVSTGLGAEKARADAMNLANAVAAVGGTNDHLQRMAINLQQIRNIGKANGLDIKQFGYAGINIYKLLEETMGLNVDQLQKMDITYEQITAALEHAAAAGGMYHGALKLQAESILGMLEQVYDRIKYAGAAIGDAVMPVVRPAMEMLIKFFESLAAFAETDFGRGIIQLITALAVLLTVLGSIIVVLNLARIAAFRTAIAFSKVVQEQILVALEAGQIGLAWKIIGAQAVKAVQAFLPLAATIAAVTGYFYLAYKAIMSTDNSMQHLGFAMLALFGPIGWIVGGIIGLVRGFRDFDALLDGTGERMKGITGWFQQLAGVIRGVQMAFQYWDIAGEGTFAWTQEMETALDRMGIKEFVISLITWIARIEALFKGIAEGFMLVMTTISGIGLAIVNAFLPANQEVASWDELLNRNKATLQSWKEIGLVIGASLGVLIVALTIKFVAMGAAALFAFWPVILTVALVVLAIAGLVVAVQVLALTWEWLKTKSEPTLKSMDDGINKWNADVTKSAQDFERNMGEAFSSVGTGFGQMFDYLGEELGTLGPRAYQWGADFFTQFFLGIQSIWHNITGWLADQINESPIGSLMEKVGIGKFVGSSGVSSEISSGKKNKAEAGMAGMAAGKGNMYDMFNMYSQPAAAASQPTTVNLVVDNEVMYSKMFDLMAVKEARK